MRLLSVLIQKYQPATVLKKTGFKMALPFIEKNFFPFPILVLSFI